MKVSFIIPTYNNEAYIRSCLNSVIASDCEIYEIIVIDNASMDDTANIVVNEYKDVNLIIQNENKGVASAVNTGIKRARGEYIAVIHADAVIDKHWASHILTLMSKNKKIFSCCGVVYESDGAKRILSAGLGLPVTLLPFMRIFSPRAKIPENGKEIIAPHNVAAMYKKELFYKIGYFDELFFSYYEDIDIGIRAVIKGYCNMFCPAATAYSSSLTPTKPLIERIKHHSVGSSALSDSENTEITGHIIRLKVRNRMYLYYKNFSFLMRLKSCLFINNQTRKIKKYYKKTGYFIPYEQGVKEAKYSRGKLLTREYKKAKFSGKIRSLWLMFKDLFASKGMFI